MWAKENPKGRHIPWGFYIWDYRNPRTDSPPRLQRLPHSQLLQPLQVRPLRRLKSWVYVKPNLTIKDRMKSLRTLRQGKQITFVNLCKGIVKTIHVTITESLMVTRLPLIDNIDNLSLANCTCLVSTDDKVIDLSISQIKVFIRSNAIVLPNPKVKQLTQSPRNDLVKVGKDILGMTISNFT